VINKFQELCIEVQVIDPDIVAISESWANEGIGDYELKLDGYTLFRKDRALEVTGGGVLLYVKEKFNACEVKLRNQFPEQVWCRIKTNDNREVLVYMRISENWSGRSPVRILSYLEILIIEV